MRLTNGLHKISPDLYKIVWYDSVIETGQLKWQNELNEKNKPFFDLCDAFFVNYTWNEENLISTKSNAFKRSDDVYVGVDVFGRNQLGGGGFNCNLAVELIQKHGLNIALFAPGWLYECHDKEKFIENTEKFWKLLDAFVTSRSLNTLPLVTSFSHGCAKKFHVNGKQVLETNRNGWFNLNVQSLMPALSKSKNMEWDFEDAFYGANCILIKPSSETIKLFKLSVNLNKNQNYYLDYIFKTSENDKLFDAKEFCVILNYQNKEKTMTKKLVFNLEDSQNEEFDINLHECLNLQESWQRRSYILKVKEDGIHLTELSLANGPNEQKLIKLGMLRIIDTKSEDLIQLQPFKSDFKTKIFTLSRQVYLCIDVQWKKLIQNVNYYNVFIDETVNNDSNDSNKLRFIGTSKIESFLICLKMNENLEFNPVQFSAESKLQFNIHIQGIDKCMDSLIYNNGLGELGNSFHRINITAKGIKLRNQDLKNLKFYDEIIYDFEAFE